MKINKLALAFIMVCTIAAPLLAQENKKINSMPYMSRGVISLKAEHQPALVGPLKGKEIKLLSQNIESDAKCLELFTRLADFDANKNAISPGITKELNLTKEDLTENRICIEALPYLVSIPEFHKEKYLEIAEITDLLAEIAGGIDNLRVEFELSPEGNWFRGSLLAYWFWADYVTPQRNLHYAYYLIGKGASKQEMMQVYQDRMSIKKFVRNYGSEQSKALLDVIAK